MGRDGKGIKSRTNRALGLHAGILLIKLAGMVHGSGIDLNSGEREPLGLCFLYSTCLIGCFDLSIYGYVKFSLSISSSNRGKYRKNVE
jgi:hypothetical protein